jgi:uncharacterized membrane protein YozB (DUF420 family)
VDAKLSYWAGAWVNMALIVTLAAAGISQARRGLYTSHERLMWAGAALVVLFVLSYAAKLYWLGREALETWSPQLVTALRVHEACVAVMLAAGVTAIIQAKRLDLASTAARARAASQPAGAAGVRLHRRAGWIAFAGGLCGLLTAAYVLYGMSEL